MLADAEERLHAGRPDATMIRADGSCSRMRRNASTPAGPTIVGVGASAGGIEALTRLFTEVCPGGPATLTGRSRSSSFHDLRDQAVPLRDGETIVRVWRGATIVRTCGLGHHKILRDPAVIAGAVAFLSASSLREALPAGA